MNITATPPLVRLLQFIDQNPALGEFGFDSEILSESQVLEIHHVMFMTYGITSPQIPTIYLYGQIGEEQGHRKVLPREYVELLARVYEQLRPETRSRFETSLQETLDIIYALVKA
jgi:hypothetical protein